MSFNPLTLERINTWIEAIALNVGINPITVHSDVCVNSGNCITATNSPCDSSNLNVAVFGCNSDRTNQRRAAITLKINKS